MALFAAHFLLPEGTYNLDELVYLNQAEGLRHGQATYDAAEHLPDFRPYLTGVEGDRVVFKYQPLWPAWLALSEAATGGHRLGLVLAGALAGLAFWLLGRELAGGRWLGTATALVAVTSPVFVAHSATALAYLPTAALAAAVLGALLRGERLESWRWFAAAGLLLGALFFHRPFDAVMVGVPVGVWLVVRARVDRSWRRLLAVALAAAPALLLFCAYNQVTSGSPLTPAFTVGAEDDRFGFGERSSWGAADSDAIGPEQLDYTPSGAARTMKKFATITPAWVAGGVVGLALVGAALVLGRRDARRWLLAGSMAAVVAGFSLWWGTENFVLFTLQRSLGPAYWLAGLGPLAALTVVGARDVVAAVRRREDRWPVRPLLAVAVVVVLATAGLQYRRLDDALGDAADLREDQLAPIDAGPAGSVVLLPVGPGDPFVRTLVPIDLDGTSRLHAVDLESSVQRFRLLDRFPDRSLWGWLADRPVGTELDLPAGYLLTELVPVRLDRLEVTGAVVHPADEATVTEAWVRTLDESREEITRATITVDPGSRDLAGAAVPTDAEARLPAVEVGERPGWLALGATIDRGDGALEIVELRWAVRSVSGGQVEVVGPGLGFRMYSFPDGERWLPEDVSERLGASIDGLPEPPAVRRIDPVP